MSNVTRLRTAAPTPPRSPERAALAEAIKRHVAAEAEAKRIEDAKSRFMDVYWAESDGLGVVSATLAELKADEGRILAAAYLGDTAEAQKLESARRAVERGEGAVAKAKKTLDGLEAREAEAKRELESAAYALDHRHAEAVKADPAIAALVEHYEHKKRELAELSLIMSETSLFTPQGYNYTAQQIYRNLSQADANAWRDAIAAMRTNPDALLPVVDRVERVICDPQEAS